MHAEHVRDLRRRKIELYASLLPTGALALPSDDLLDDGAFAATLDQVAKLAPPGFGFLAGSRRRLSGLGVLGHVSLSCASLQEVLELWLLYADSAGELVTMTSRVEGEGDDALWSLQIEPFLYLPRLVAEMIMDEMSTAFFVYAKEMCGRTFSDFSVELAHAPSPAAHYAVIPGHVTFDRPVTRLIGPVSALALAVAPADQPPFAAVVDQLGGDRAQLAGIGPTALKLYEYLVRRRGETPSLSAAAAAMALSARTLVRRLGQEGVTYGFIVDDYRRQYALTLIRYGGFQAKQIAHLVGFRSENGLRKAFKTWTGSPVGSWQSKDDV